VGHSSLPAGWYKDVFPGQGEGEGPRRSRPGRELRLASVRKSWFLAAILGLLFPGAGHLYLGRRDKALFFAVGIGVCFVVGLVLADFQAVSWQKHPYHFLAQAWNVLPTLVTGWLTRSLRVVRELPLLDMGLLYTSVAGLLNVIAVLDAGVLAHRSSVSTHAG